MLLTPELEAILTKVCELNEKSLQQIKLIKEIKKNFQNVRSMKITLGRNEQNGKTAAVIELMEDGKVYLNTYKQKNGMSDFKTLFESIELDDTRVKDIGEYYKRLRPNDKSYLCTNCKKENVFSRKPSKPVSKNIAGYCKYCGHVVWY